MNSKLSRIFDTEIKKKYKDTRTNAFLICGEYAGSLNRLNYSTTTVEIYTPYKELDNIYYNGFLHEHNHLSDIKFIRNIAENVYVYNREKCIIDTIKFLNKNYNEGLLIEMLQNYTEQENDDLTKLYEVGEYYNVSKEDIDYWVKEAKEETDMSMG